MSEEKMDLELKQLEEELRGFSPSPVSGEMLSRMVEAMERWEQAEEQVDNAPAESLESSVEGGNVVEFPAEKKSQSKGASWGPMWAAAAAVAVLGAAMGVFLPSKDSSSIAAMSDLGPVPVLRQASLVPVNIQRKVSSINAGKVSNRDGVEYQVISVVREEQADFRGSDNVGLKITRPKVDYYVVPVSY